MPRPFYLAVLIVGATILIVLIGDKNIQKMEVLIKSLPRSGSLAISLVRRLFTTKSPSNRHGRFHSKNNAKGNQYNFGGVRAAFLKAFEEHFNPKTGLFKKHDLHNVIEFFYRSYQPYVSELKGKDFRALRNKLCLKIHPDKAANSRLTVDEATTVFQYFNEYFPKS